MLPRRPRVYLVLAAGNDETKLNKSQHIGRPACKIPSLTSESSLSSRFCRRPSTLPPPSICLPVLHRTCPRRCPPRLLQKQIKNERCLVTVVSGLRRIADMFREVMPCLCGGQRLPGRVCVSDMSEQKQYLALKANAINTYTLPQERGIFFHGGSKALFQGGGAQQSAVKFHFTNFKLRGKYFSSKKLIGKYVQYFQNPRGLAPSRRPCANCSIFKTVRSNQNDTPTNLL